MRDRPSRWWWGLPTVFAAILIAFWITHPTLATWWPLVQVWAVPPVEPVVVTLAFILLSFAMYYRVVQIAWKQRLEIKDQKWPTWFAGIRFDHRMAVRLVADGAVLGVAIGLLCLPVLGVELAAVEPSGLTVTTSFLAPLAGTLLFCVIGFTLSLRPRHTPTSIDPFSAFHVTKAAVYFLVFIFLWWVAASWFTWWDVLAPAADWFMTPDVTTPDEARTRMRSLVILKDGQTWQRLIAVLVLGYLGITVVCGGVLTVLARMLVGDIRLGKSSRIFPLFASMLGYWITFSVFAWHVWTTYFENGPSLEDRTDLIRTAVLGWSLSVVPILFTLPGFLIGAEDRAESRRARGPWRKRIKELSRSFGTDVRNARARRAHAREAPQSAWEAFKQWMHDYVEPWIEPIVTLLAAAQAQQVRGHLALLTIIQNHVAVFLASLPASVILSISVVVTGSVNPFVIPSVVGTTLAWLGPLLSGLYLIEDTYQRAYQRGLHRCLHRLRDHTVVYGFGDLTRRFIREQLSKGVWSYETLFDHLQWSENILMPTGRLGKVLTYVAAVDADGELGTAATTTAEELTVTAVDFTSEIHDAIVERDRPPDIGPDVPREFVKPLVRQREVPVDLVVPVVVGDTLSEEAQRLVRLRDAGFVAVLLPAGNGPERSHGLFRRLEKLAEVGRQIPAVIEVHSSRYVPYVAGRALSGELPVHLVHSDHIEGLNAANVLFAAVEKERALEAERIGLSGAARAETPFPRILVCGRDRQTFYLVDAFLKSLAIDDYRKMAASISIPSRGVGHPRFDPKLLLVGERTTFTECEFSMIDWATLGTQGHLGREWQKLRLRWGLHWISYNRFIERDPVGAADAGSLDTGSVALPLIAREATDQEVLRDVLEHFDPDIVLLAGYEPDVQLRILQALFILLRRHPDDRRLPLILVSGRTGKRHVARYFTDALLYYSALWVKAGEESSQRFVRYPSPAIRRSKPENPFRGDAFIDVMEDPVERLNGLLRCYTEFEPGVGVPLQLDFCVPETGGVMGANLAALANARVAPDETPARSAVVPSLLNARFVLSPVEKRGQRTVPFAIRSFARLVPAQTVVTAPRFARLTLTHGRTVAKQTSIDVHATMRKLLDAAAIQGEPPGEIDPDTNAADWTRYCETHREPLLKQLDDCCGMATCPVEAIQKSVEAMRWTVATRAAQGPQGSTLQAKRLNLLSQRFLTAGYGGCHDRREEYVSPAASLYIECVDGDLPGTFATALNALAFRKLAPATPAQTHWVNLKYVTAYECHDKRFGVFTCYGVLEPRAGSLPGAVIRRLRLRHITDRDAWLTYLKALQAFLQDLWGRTYTLDDTTSPFEIVLFTRLP